MGTVSDCYSGANNIGDEGMLAIARSLPNLQFLYLGKKWENKAENDISLAAEMEIRQLVGQHILML